LGRQYHNHHIVPKYLGGTDDKSNIVRITIDEHAEAHRQLFEMYGDIRDYVAYKSLLKQMEQEERIKILSSLGGKNSAKIRKARRNDPHMIKSREKRSKKYAGKGNPMFGIHRNGKDSPALKYKIVTPFGEYYGLGEACANHPNIPIRTWCISRTDVPFTQYKKSLKILGTKEEVIGKTPRDFGYYSIPIC
jgi:hypothetical protein